MNEEVLQLSFRWTHLVTGVLWVGVTYTLAWVLPCPTREGPAREGPAREGIDATAPARARAWLRYGALASWLTGASLLMLLYYSGSYPYLLDGGASPGPGDWIPAFAGLGLGFLSYDVWVWLGQRRGSKALAESGPWALLLATLVYVALLERAGLSRRAMHVHAGAFLGTAMLGNVWLRLPALPGRPEGAELRIRHNARFSIPLLCLMVSVDQPTLIGHDPWLASLAAVLTLGYGLGWWLERALPRSTPG